MMGYSGHSQDQFGPLSPFFVSVCRLSHADEARYLPRYHAFQLSLSALDPLTGRVSWRIPVEPRFQPVGAIYCGGRWPSDPDLNVAADGHFLYAIRWLDEQESEVLQAFDQIDGHVVWTTRLDRKIRYSHIWLRGDVIWIDVMDKRPSHDRRDPWAHDRAVAFDSRTGAQRMPGPSLGPFLVRKWPRIPDYSIAPIRLRDVSGEAPRLLWTRVFGPGELQLLPGRDQFFVRTAAGNIDVLDVATGATVTTLNPGRAFGDHTAVLTGSLPTGEPVIVTYDGDTLIGWLRGSPPTSTGCGEDPARSKTG